MTMLLSDRKGIQPVKTRSACRQRFSWRTSRGGKPRGQEL